MKEPTFDADGYPTAATLRRVRKWSYEDCRGLMAFVKKAWKYVDIGYWTVKKTDDGSLFSISTGGWSGNESLIDAMQGNTMFWSLCWESSRRGGHYEFIVR